MDLQPEQAVLVKFDVSTEKEIGPEEVVSLSLLHPGDVVKIRPGCKIPADGVVISGRSSVDESMITGESVPVVKEKDSVAIGSTINQDGLLYVQIEHVGEDSMLFQIIRLVEDAQSHKAPIQDFADKVSAYFVPAIIGLALITFLVWIVLLETGADVVPRDWYPAGHGAGFLAISFGLSVLVISCPCALGLAVRLYHSNNKNITHKYTNQPTLRYPLQSWSERVSEPKMDFSLKVQTHCKLQRKSERYCSIRPER